MTPLRYSVAEISKQDIYKDGVPVGFPKGAPAKCCRLVVWQFAHCHIRLMYFAKVLDKWKCFFFTLDTRTQNTYTCNSLWLFWDGEFTWPFSEVGSTLTCTTNRGLNLASEQRVTERRIPSYDFVGLLGCFECHKTPPGLGGGFKRFYFHAEPWEK